MKLITILTNIIHKTTKFIKPFVPIILLLTVLLIILHLFFNNLNLNNDEGFVNHKQRVFESNKFQQITLPNIKNYDIELAIPAGQILHSTVQGNWGISTDANNEGMTMGVYRDGYSADGSIFKGKHGKLYKRMLEQGPYVLKYEVRNGKDVKIYVNNKKIHDLKDQAVPSGELKVIGTNYHNYNHEAKNTGRGRREIDYIKFIPKEMKEGFIGVRKNLWSDWEGMENLNISKSQINEAMKVVKDNPEIVKEIGSLVMEQMNNHKSKSNNSHPQLQKNLMAVLNNSGLGNMPELSLKEGMSITGQSNTQNNVNRVLHKNELCGPAKNLLSDSEYKYKKGYACSGRTIGDYDLDKNDCVDKCKETNSCKCVTYFPQKNRNKCRLETGVKATFRGTSAPYLAHSLADNEGIGTEYPKCIEECNDNKGCNAIRWREKNKRCDLLSKCDTKITKEGWNTMTFMAKDPKIQRTPPPPPNPNPSPNDTVHINKDDYKKQLQMKAELKDYFKKNEKISKKKMMEIGNKYKPDDLTTVKEKIFLKYVDMVFAKGAINRSTAEQLMGGSLTDGPKEKNKFFRKPGPDKPHKKLQKGAFEHAVEAATKQLGKIREGFLA